MGGREEGGRSECMEGEGRKKRGIGEEIVGGRREEEVGGRREVARRVERRKSREWEEEK